MCGSSTDITDRIRAEETIRRLNADLERRVVERTAELAAVNEELETVAYAVSHDPRAPLRAMSGFSHALSEEYAPLFDEAGRIYVNEIGEAGVRMG